MNSAQRTLLIVGMVLVALSLHISLFEWSRALPELHAGIFSTLGCQLVDDECLKLYYDAPAMGNHFLAVIAGLILPIVLIAVSCYLAVPLISGSRKDSNEPGH